jgi:cell wall-associated NlpC family hydrolase
MNEQIKELAEQAGFAVYGWNENEFKKFAALVAAHEREECAKVCESYLSESPYSWGGTTMANAIRARGTT